MFTIILQENRIKELEKRNKELETGYHQVWKENDRLRKQIQKTKKRDNELNKVNV
jgi:uncharacterized hydantoinase/oxoprolinase family protein